MKWLREIFDQEESMSERQAARDAMDETIRRLERVTARLEILAAERDVIVRKTGDGQHSHAPTRDD